MGGADASPSDVRFCSVETGSVDVPRRTSANKVRKLPRVRHRREVECWMPRDQPRSQTHDVAIVWRGRSKDEPHSG
jgi:ribosomal protein S12